MLIVVFLSVLVYGLNYWHSITAVRSGHSTVVVPLKISLVFGAPAGLCKMPTLNLGVYAANTIALMVSISCWLVYGVIPAIAAYVRILGWLSLVAFMLEIYVERSQK